MEPAINPDLPTIGIVVFDGFLTNEVLAPLDVFTKKDSAGSKLFNVVLIGAASGPYTSEEGLCVLPHCTMENTPDLAVLVVPSSMTPEMQTSDKKLVAFIKKQNEHTQYTASHCAGAFLLGEAGVADGKKIVTYCGGSKTLQHGYPNLLVQDDNVTRVVRDGKIISSNGNLVSYIASLDLLEVMTSSAHRTHVENELLIHKLR
jgi:transcriptional regulator GlxA family with amidase domain